VHNGELYAANWNYDYTSRRNREYESWDYCHVYRYRGGTEWEDCGQPGKNRRLFSLASYRGRLYAAGDGATKDPARECYVYEGGQEWRICGEFNDLPCALAVHDGRLYLGTSGGGRVYAYDGESWEALGNPDPSITQVHSMQVYRRELCVGTWPKGTVAAYRDRGWQLLGRASLDDIHSNIMEINALAVHNGKLYAGTLPVAGVWRYEGGAKWTLLRRFLDRDPADGKEWTRLTSLTTYDGKLFASVGCASSSIWDAPRDVRGGVFCVEAGKCVSYDRDLGSGWKHVAAVKEGDRLKLYLNGDPVARSSHFEPEAYDVSNDQPLNIGLGETDYFSGKIREVRLYNRAIGDQEVKSIYLGSEAGRRT
jgi:outer membrane protein assembly factor BamB